MEDEELKKLRQETVQMARKFQRMRSEKEKTKNQAKMKVPNAGKVYDEEEMALLVDSALDFWLTAGRFTDQFETELAEACGLKHAMMVNSGSSANLVALSALTSKFLGSKKLKRGDEVITAAASFPTTINPIFQNCLVPVILDVELETYNIDVSMVEEAITDKTKAVMVAHTLGNPFDVETLAKICKERGLYLVEDCCDAFGSTFNGKKVGTFGDFATLSFYPAHHITTGEGGAVLTNNDLLKRAAESFRDWGRDCWCKTGCDNTCGKRFDWKLGELPRGYDHKFIYSNIGYNLKATDMQAAIGIAQLKKVQGFIKKRKENFKDYYEFFKKHEEYFILPKSYPEADPSHFGYLVNIREGAPFARTALVPYLEEKGISTRMLFGGNIIRQPAYIGENYRVVGELKNADHLMNNAFWVGVYPGITAQMREYVKGAFTEFLSKY